MIGRSLNLTPEKLLVHLARESTAAPIPGAVWYTAQAIGDGLAYSFPVGALARACYLTADFLVDGNYLVVFQLALQEGESGPAFHLIYSALNQCSARLRLPLEAVNQNRWRYEREGAWLKPMCGGERVDLQKVDRMTITVLRKAEIPVRWCLTSVTATVEEPPLLKELLLPKGLLLDELGQSTLHDWPTKTRSPQEVTERLHSQLAAAPKQRWPEGFSRWGGWLNKRVEASGFFRTHHDGRRWWLIDPDGYFFWSAGPDCVRVDVESAAADLAPALAWVPESDGPYQAATHHRDGQVLIHYLATNFIRAFGPEVWQARWTEITLAELRRLGFNTVANWSEWEIARAAGFPYVRPLRMHFRHTPTIYRDFPDVFHPGFEPDAAMFAEQLRETADDPAFIGYFLMNEPTWGFAQETPAAGMLFNTPVCATRQALSAFLRERYHDDAVLSAAWGPTATTLAAVAEGEWRVPLTESAKADLAAFSEVMVERFFNRLTEACRKVDPHHLNLGARYYTVPPEWAVKGMQAFDVFSMNCYRQRVPAEDLEQISQRLGRPVLIGEWHFGALDVGLPGSGIGRVRDQAARGQAFRIYTEYAAAQPSCIGAHYFTLYDESALGRFDGENWNIGLMDVCNRPYEPLTEAARVTHERLYPVALGEVEPYADAPEYLPWLFL